MRLLLLSNSTNFGEGFLDHAAAEIDSFLGPARRVLFVPFALRDQHAYWEQVRARLGRIGRQVECLRADSSGPSLIEAAAAVFIGGGNTFRLLSLLQKTRVLDPLRRKIRDGIPYIGSSAGTVVAAPTLMTTNDMPIVEPESFESIGLVPFQINCHYVDADPASRHMGETRELRIEQFLEENEIPVLGLREGGWVRVEGTRVSLGGRSGARLFRRGLPPEEFAAGSDLSFLLV